MRQILFIQGAGEDVHEKWDNKLVENLRRELGREYEVRYPIMPNEADPQFAVWRVAEDIEPRSDLGTRLPPSVPVLLYHGDKDATAPVSHVALYAEAIPHALVRRLADRDHQLNNDLSEVASDIRELERRG